MFYISNSTIPGMEPRHRRGLHFVMAGLLAVGMGHSETSVACTRNSCRCGHARSTQSEVLKGSEATQPELSGLVPVISPLAVLAPLSYSYLPETPKNEVESFYPGLVIPTVSTGNYRRASFLLELQHTQRCSHRSFSRVVVRQRHR